MRKLAGVIAECVCCVQIGVFSEQICQVSSDHQITIGGEQSVSGKSEGDAGGELPIGEIHRIGGPVVELDVLVIIVSIDWIIHQLIDYNVSDEYGAVVGPGCAGGQRIKRARPIRPTAK